MAQAGIPDFSQEPTPSGSGGAFPSGMQGFPLSAAPTRTVPISVRLRLASAEVLAAFRSAALNPFYEKAADAIEACAPLTRRSVEMTRQAGRRLKGFKEERPLQLIGTIAGFAFVLGVAARFWRSKR